MAANQIGLKLVELVGGNSDVGELSEAGIDPVDRLTGLHRPIHQAPALEQGTPGLGLEGDPHSRRPGLPYHFIDRQRSAVEDAGWLGHRPKLPQSERRFNPCATEVARSASV